MAGMFGRRALVGAAVLGLALAGEAGAQGRSGAHPLPPPVDAAIDGVTVSVPRVVERTRYQSLISDVEISMLVPYGDLDLSTPAGVAELDERVAAAGRYGCEQLERMYRHGTPQRFDCVREAISEAQPQVNQARGLF